MAVVPGEGEPLPHAGRVAVLDRECLPRRIGAEFPHAAALFELRARVHALRAGLAIRLRAGVRRQPHVDVDVALVVERDVFVLVPSLLGESTDHDLRRARGDELTWRHLEAFDRRGGGVVEIPVPEHDARGAAGTEALGMIQRAVAVRVPQCHEKPGLRRLTRCARARANGHVDVAVGRDDEVASRADVVRDHLRAESRRQREPAVIGVAGRLRRLLPSKARRACQHASGDRQRSHHAIHHDTVLSR